MLGRDPALLLPVTIAERKDPMIASADRVLTDRPSVAALSYAKGERVIVLLLRFGRIDHDPVVALQEQHLSAVHYRIREPLISIMRAAEVIKTPFGDPFVKVRVRPCLPVE